jgi:DNA repair protein RAD5
LSPAFVSLTETVTVQVTIPCEKNPEEGIRTLQTALQPLLLRRTKDTRTKSGKPIVSLPSSDVQIVKLTFDEAERDFYTAIYSRSKAKFDQFIAAGSALSQYANILEMLLRLRQSCDHPCLTLKRDAKKGPVRAKPDAIFADIGDLIETFMEAGEKKNMTPAFASEVAAQLHSLAPGNGAGAASVAPTGDEDLGAPPDPNLVECCVCLDQPPTEPVITPCAHIGCAECFTSVVDTVNICPVCRTDMVSSDLVRVRCAVDEDEDDGVSASQEELQQFRPSTKLKALMVEVCAMPSETKCIIFSQWTSMLDLVEIGLRKESRSFARIDGSVPEQSRAKVLEAFAKSDGCDVLLLTLKVGGVGLNLTAANYVFLLDPWYVLSPIRSVCWQGGSPCAFCPACGRDFPTETRDREKESEKSVVSNTAVICRTQRLRIRLGVSQVESCGRGAGNRSSSPHWSEEKGGCQAIRRNR